jgi:hypothetical protein
VGLVQGTPVSVTRDPQDSWHLPKVPDPVWTSYLVPSIADASGFWLLGPLLNDTIVVRNLTGLAECNHSTLSDILRLGLYLVVQFRIYLHRELIHRSSVINVCHQLILGSKFKINPSLVIYNNAAEPRTQNYRRLKSCTQWEGPGNTQIITHTNNKVTVDVWQTNTPG